MTTLAHILRDIETITVHGSTDIPVSGLTADSRMVAAGTVFFALPGTRTDGHLYIDKAISRGAAAVVCERLPAKKQDAVTYVQVADAHRSIALMAGNYYGRPSEKLYLTGITGTNGKTTLATLSYELFEKAGYKAGLLSTVSVRIGQEELPATHTTPDPVSLNGYLARMVRAGVTHCFMEVSSHGIEQERIAGLRFAGGVFTNLTHDHLDYHGTFKAYRDAKKKFFDRLPDTAFALTNVDDKNGAFMLQNTRAHKRSYAVKTPADYQVRILENSLEGLWLRINGTEMWSRLIGSFNAYNLAAIYGIAREYGMEHGETLRLMSELHSVRGRFQYFINPEGITVVVDYAHTPDALKNVLSTMKELKKDNSRLITVVGAGGNRDKGKRPRMAEIASLLSDTLILTSDNPRDEDPLDILSDMEAGVPGSHRNKMLVVPDREQAIRTAAQIAVPDDMVLIAGKGHETYQEIKGVKHDFDDMKVAAGIFVSPIKNKN